ncbi:response regulator transcription factor [Rhodococcus fascians]|nr:response regulator transcription factor [Rhodococcus fascians]MBY3810293.1 response regulator transcription factor [Rhodococcus fascians]MBY3842084.1 response regulator transcription factor [Rhodococcus fascians]MBY3844535.1 response regulator transcription factor [Rhodococcus fascians]MBY3850481.1 response regulator transcription factor [Rhodococcus fascians]
MIYRSAVVGDTKNVRVVVVDDEALVRSGFELILGAAPGIDVVATGDAADALDLVVGTEPDVVLLDIRMPGRNGLDVLADILALPQPPAVAMLTTFDSDDFIMRALDTGAAGFLVKDTDPEELPRHIRSLAAGGIVLSPTVGRTVVRGFLGAARDSTEARKIARLTERERAVLVRVVHGDSNAEIAAALFLGTGTVKDHVSAILSKLDVSTRVQAALIAERGGLSAGGSTSVGGESQ